MLEKRHEWEVIFLIYKLIFWSSYFQQKKNPFNSKYFVRKPKFCILTILFSILPTQIIFLFVFFLGKKKENALIQKQK